jgi:Zn ribbon nucleic-acid-binding protein
MNLAGLKCPKCRATRCLTGLQANDTVCIWCVHCNTYLQGPADKVAERWKAGEGIRDTHGKLLEPQGET